VAAPQEPKAAAPSSSVPAPPISKPESKPVVAPAPIVAAPIVAAPAKPEIPKNLAELEKAVENAATQAVKEYNKAVFVLKSYNDDVKNIVDSAVENIDVNAWTALKNKTLTRDTAVEAAEQAALAARKKLNELEQQIDKNVVEITAEVKSSLKQSISSFNEHLNAAKVEVLKAKELAGTSENYWKKVESARSYFVNEIESLFGVNLNERKLNLSKEEVDLFLLNAYSHVTAYQKELYKIQTEGELRLRRALDAVRGADQTEAVKAQLEYELEKERRNLNLQNQAKVRKFSATLECFLTQFFTIVDFQNQSRNREKPSRTTEKAD
jgi:mitofilin